MTDQPSANDIPNQPYPADWSPWTRRVAAILLLGALVLGIFFFGPVLKAAILALILTYVLYFPVRFVTRHTRMSHGLATALVVFLFLLIIAALFATLAMPLSGEFNHLAQSVKSGAEKSLQFLQNYTPDQGWLHDPKTGRETVNLNLILQPLSDLSRRKTGPTDMQPLLSGAGAMMGTLTKTLDVVSGTLGSGLLVALLAVLFLLEIPAASRWIKTLIPSTHRREYAILGYRIGRKWNSYFKAAAITAVLLGVLNAIQMVALGIPSALAIGFMSAILGLIPIIGGVISVVIIVIVSLVEGSTTLAMNPVSLALLAVGINMVIQSVVWHIIFPLLSKDAVARIRARRSRTYCPAKCRCGHRRVNVPRWTAFSPEVSPATGRRSRVSSRYRPPHRS